ncbi:MAG: SPOR domain-containing protein [Bacteroidales bacterium]|mgnify:CR=1 FL=1|nr:SPOR domain-containing protein [Bacteroidales bacterium]
MKKTLLTLISCLIAFSAMAQSEILSELPPSVKVHQSEAVRSAFEEQMLRNESSSINGFRIRIYTGNGKDSDLESARALKEFKAAFPDLPAERSYTHSSFKVTVGYFRTKTDAARELKRIRQNFPNSFLVGESFRYPTLPSERKAILEAMTAAGEEGEGEQ